MKALLVVLNPRRIKSCLASYEALSVDRCYLRGYWEHQLAEAAKGAPEYDRYVIVSDDCIVDQQALDAVLHHLGPDHPVVTGYCSLDSRHFRDWVNLSTLPIHDPVPRVENYSFMRFADVAESEEPLIQTHFVGMSLTGLTREMWERFPFEVTPIGAQTDYSLSYRLTQAGIPMWAARDAYIEHVKEVWNTPDADPEKRLLVGEIPAEVRVEKAPDPWVFKPYGEAVAELREATI